MTWQPIESLRMRMTRSHDIRQGNMVELYRVGGPNNPNFNTTALKVGTLGANGSVYNPFGNTAAAGSVASNAGAAVGGGLSVASGIQIVGAPNVNLNRLAVQGFDFEAAYGRQMGPGRFSVRGLVNYQPHNQQVNFQTGQTTERANTLGSQPKLGYNLSFGYDVGRWKGNLQVRGFGSRIGNNVVYAANGSIDATTVLGPEDGAAYTSRVASATAVAGGAAAGTVAASTNTISKNRWPGQYFVNAGLKYDVNDHITTYVNIDNLLNRLPPELTTSAALYDFIGRRYRIGVRANF